ncbi:MAG: hypothetical protein LBH09_07830 [Peptococcaceae bacterium]|jgi:predicted RNA-binding Zn-ribbon protein involved in translation (DUF1610 family)|nr:hypothetical protein [Peptococcaceae bacterium]
MEWFRNFMRGRHGTDHLTYFLLIVYWPLELIGRYIGIKALEYIAFVCLFTAIFRSVSKNIARRRYENQKFLKFVRPLSQWLSLTFRKIKDRNTHRYFKCPGCGQILRVPAGKGKIKARCSKCGASIDAKT